MEKGVVAVVVHVWREKEREGKERGKEGKVEREKERKMKREREEREREMRSLEGRVRLGVTGVLSGRAISGWL